MTGYELLDSGNQMKLERFGEFVCARPAAQAVWGQGQPKLWKDADATFDRESSGRGQWRFRRRSQDEWQMSFAGLEWGLRRNDFGHVGIFPEQEDSWGWIRQKVAERGEEAEVLNLFAYTGGSTLAAASAGGRVVHLDASKSSVRYARENAMLSGLADAPIRWIVEDAVKFVEREQRRGRCYDGIVLDPPSYGRGAKGEKWKIEDLMLPFLRSCQSILKPKGAFMLLSSHSPGFTPLVLANLLESCGAGSITHGEMVMREAGGRELPNGAYARWENQG